MPDYLKCPIINASLSLEEALKVLADHKKGLGKR
jgi:hypothetical protein